MLDDVPSIVAMSAPVVDPSSCASFVQVPVDADKYIVPAASPPAQVPESVVYATNVPEASPPFSETVSPRVGAVVPPES
jgi:hypothetical protein